MSAEDTAADELVENNDKAADDVINESNKNKEADDKNLTYDGSDLIEWITSNGGFIHPNARIGLDPTGQYRGVFVKNVGGTEGGTEEGIEEDDLVASIPWYVSLSHMICMYIDYNCILIMTSHPIIIIPPSSPTTLLIGI